MLLCDHLTTSQLSCFGGGTPTLLVDRLALRADRYTGCFADSSFDLLQACQQQLPEAVCLTPQSESADLKLVHAALKSSRMVLLPLELKQGISTLDAWLRQLADSRISDELRCQLVLTACQGISTPAAAPESESSTASKAPRNVEQASHVPLLIAPHEQQVSRCRTQLLTTHEIPGLLALLLQQPDVYEDWRDRKSPTQIEYAVKHFRAIRSRDWLLLESQTRQSAQEFPDPVCSEHPTGYQPAISTESDYDPTLPVQIELYRKPEDIWEAFDVADQHPQIVESFEKTGKLPGADASTE